MKFKFITFIILIISGYFIFFTDFTYKLSLSNIQKEIYEDYKFYWEFAKENFATYYVMENDKELQESIYNKYKNLIVDCHSFNDFSSLILNPMVEEMFITINDHTTIVGNTLYNTLNNVYSDAIQSFPDTGAITSVEYLLSIINQSENFYEEKKLDNQTIEKENNNVNNKIEFNEIDYDIAYIKLPSMNYSEELVNTLIAYIKEAAKYENIIIDIRGNFGGSTMMVYPFFEYLSQQDLTYSNIKLINNSRYNSNYIKTQYQGYYEEIKSIKQLDDIDDKFLSSVDSFFRYNSTIYFNEDKYTGFDGTIFIIVDENVFSASETFTAISKRSGFATIVGKSATRGDGMNTDPNLFMLPNSHILVRYNESFALNADGSANIEMGTSVDLTVPKDNDELEFLIEYLNNRQ